MCFVLIGLKIVGPDGKIARIIRETERWRNGEMARVLVETER